MKPKKAPETDTIQNRESVNDLDRSNDQGINEHSGPLQYMTLNKPMKCKGKLFNPRNIIQIGTWNVRTMFASGTVSFVAKEMKKISPGYTRSE